MQAQHVCKQLHPGYGVLQIRELVHYRFANQKPQRRVSLVGSLVEGLVCLSVGILACMRRVHIWSVLDQCPVRPIVRVAWALGSRDECI